MERKKVNDIVKSLDWEGLIEITELKKELDDLEKLGATHIHMPENEYCIYPYAVRVRLETDKEFEHIVKLFELSQQRIKSGLKQLAELKAKYENICI